MDDGIHIQADIITIVKKIKSKNVVLNLIIKLIKCETEKKRTLTAGYLS
jgi:hypothetical protein